MVISVKHTLPPQVTSHLRHQAKETVTMDNAASPCHPVPDPDNVLVSARLAAIEQRLDEILGRLDEMKTSLTWLDHFPPDHRHLP